MSRLFRAAALLTCILAPAGLLPQQRLARFTLTFALTPGQQSDLDRLLAAQQDPGAPEFHQWLTPEEFGDRFGVTREDLDDVAAWLRAAGLSIESTAGSRRWIVVTGTEEQANTVFDRARWVPRRIPSHLAAVIGSIREAGDLRWTPRPIQPRRLLADGSHALAPADLAAIYGAAGDGTGQTIAIVGQSNFYVSDVQDFRTRFGLPKRDPRLVLVGEEPGFDPNGGMAEAVVDLEWAGAMAPHADLVYVYARDLLEALHATVDRNLAPVLNFSFGLCEADVPPAQVESLQALARQANAQGITLVVSSGDSGAAGCNRFGNVASLGLHVMFPASIPEATAVGGTRLNEGRAGAWVNGSATGYIPEVAWNDTLRGLMFSASGGGASAVFPKPAWQTGPGVPPKNARHVPDVAFAASPYQDPYVAVVGNSLVTLGGTSISAPVFSGVMAVVNQRAGRMGNINPLLYSAHDSGAAAGWFHDITEGDNIVPCVPGTRDCVDGVLGYRAGPGYDPVTGLGSIDIPAFVAGVRARVAKPPLRRPPAR